MTLVTPERWDFKWEMSEDGTNWLVVLEGATQKR